MFCSNSSQIYIPHLNPVYDFELSKPMHKHELIYLYQSSSTLPIHAVIGFMKVAYIFCFSHSMLKYHFYLQNIEILTNSLSLIKDAKEATLNNHANKCAISM